MVKTVLMVFEQTSYAVSVSELIKRLDGEMDKTTVYRILKRLEADGTLHSFVAKDGVKLYAKCKACSSLDQLSTHPHFHCRACGKAVCLSMDISIPSVPNYKIDSVEFLLIGLCDDCLSKH